MHRRIAAGLTAGSLAAAQPPVFTQRLAYQRLGSRGSIRKSVLRNALLLAILSPFIGCLRLDEATNPAPGTDQNHTQKVSSDIVFRARYYRSKECRHTSDGSYSLGLFKVCDVVEVLQGELKVTRLVGVNLPDDLAEDATYTFRWRPSDSTRKHLRKAEEGGYTGMWVDGENLELLCPAWPDP